VWDATQRFLCHVAVCNSHCSHMLLLFCSVGCNTAISPSHIAVCNSHCSHMLLLFCSVGCNTGIFPSHIAVCNSHCSHMLRVRQNCLRAPYMAVCMVIFLLESPYMHLIYICKYGFGQPYMLLLYRSVGCNTVLASTRGLVERSTKVATDA